MCADSTDVQGVTVTLIDGVNTSTILCDFITGSNAAGCMVVLTNEELGLEEYYNLTKSASANCSILTITLEHLPSQYNRVRAYDIECDGSIGSLAVPGQLVNYSQATCTTDLSECKCYCDSHYLLLLFNDNFSQTQQTTTIDYHRHYMHTGCSGSLICCGVSFHSDYCLQV